MTRLSSGNKLFDDFLEGGFESGVVSTIYGPAASGKTNVCMLFAIANAKKRLLWVDTEGGFSTERFKQLTSSYKDILGKMVFLKPMRFPQQHQAIMDLENNDTEFDAIIVDSLTMLYRADLADGNVKDLNDQLVKQLRMLLEVARKQDIPVIVTAQVYADLEDKEKVRVVGGTIMRNISKCLIELQKDNGERTALLIKHRSLPELKVARFTIVQEGIQEVSK